ncbi:Uncharacterized conserved protein [Cedecea davisae]|uniref:T6SS Phospholipase effector Tle1-like catalytic domain-containing protein n=1 Tax=Cedecea davisae DSM 4568 TaxID=566551 RepID=S3IRT4_9ENTR|nr:DUF2235 domain-containing protein [Cedecea davisae]EPF16493.1 hypothetical protein HMPREF0201_02856 [Cedecea davisae DSM 4568]SUX38745.1 Uncharacterized conserved protein [Cedecea davisae]
MLNLGKNIVVCCDGTGNEVNAELSNVLKLYRVMSINNTQVVYYNPGIGTIGLHNPWQRFRQKVRGLFELATGFGLDKDILNAYRYLCENHINGDKIWLFGFSRGAYTVRVLAAFVNMIGLLSKDQLNLAEYALAAYKRASSYGYTEAQYAENSSEPKRSSSALADAWHLARVTRTRKVQIEFIGVWDTVSSVFAPKKYGLIPCIENLLYTQKNPIVKCFRQAIAIDERRRMFRLHHWNDPQPFREKSFNTESDVEQNIKQVWFAGVHADIGGGYPEAESGLSKFPLAWMIKEARDCGLLVNQANINRLVFGKPRKGSKYFYVEPNATAKLHDSLTSFWKALEWIPKKLTTREWENRRSWLGFYFPRGEPRLIPEGALIHSSVRLRMKLSGYKPINLPHRYEYTDD